LSQADIEEVCGYEKDSLDSIAGYDGRVLECLQDYKDELVTPACKKRVHKLTMRAAQDIRMDRPLSDACYDDRQKLCAGVQPGDARVLRCLQDSREQLTYECRATLFDQEVRLAEDIDFQFPLKKACAAEIPRFCKVRKPSSFLLCSCLLKIPTRFTGYSARRRSRHSMSPFARRRD
jgi:Golgi apparatus protein 1